MIKNTNKIYKIISELRTGIKNLFFYTFKKNCNIIAISYGLNIQLEISVKYLYSFLCFTKLHSFCLFDFLIDLFCFDFIKSKYRFVLLYHFLNSENQLRIFLKCKISELNEKLLSISSIYKGAVWPERETFDFFGLFFYLNYDLRRILLDYGFLGYPLRKDFPLSGFIEFFYDDTLKKICHEKINLCQEYRIFLPQNKTTLTT